MAITPPGDRDEEPTSEPIYQYPGIVIGINSVYNDFGVEIEKASDVSGSAGTWASFRTLTSATDICVVDRSVGVTVGTKFWYRARLSQAGYLPGPWATAIQGTVKMLYAKFFVPTYKSSAAAGVGSGTPNALAKFDTSETFADSIIAESGTTVTVGGIVEATAFRTGNTQLDGTSLELGSTDTALPAYIDFHSDGVSTDYNARVIRWNGTNGTFEFNQQGTGSVVTLFNGVTKLTLTSAGNLTATGDVTAFSDARLKTEVTTIHDGLKIVKNLRGVRFTRIEDGHRGIGVIAQEVQEHLPEVVHEAEDGTLSVAYANIVGVLIEAVKTLSTEVETLKGQIKGLEGR